MSYKLDKFRGLEMHFLQHKNLSKNNPFISRDILGHPLIFPASVLNSWRDCFWCDRILLLRFLTLMAELRISTA